MDPIIITYSHRLRLLSRGHRLNMTAPAKKRRIQAARAAARNDLVKEDAIHDICTETDVKENADIDPKAIYDLQLQYQETMDTLLNTIQLLSSENDIDRTELILSASVSLSHLKVLQRQISLQVELHAAISKDERTKVEACSLILENLNYERNYLRREIEEVQTWKPEELEKTSCEELQIDPVKLDLRAASDKIKDPSSDVDMPDASAQKVETREEAIDTYLFGNETESIISSSHRDPSNHAYITNKLQADNVTRYSLIEQLTKHELQLKDLRKKRDESRKFLHGFPTQVAELEKAGEALNGFFNGSSLWKREFESHESGDGTDPSAVTNEKLQASNILISSPSLQRTKRFQLAQSNLPSPLYVLFVQLTGYIDAWSSLDVLGNQMEHHHDLGDIYGPNAMSLSIKESSTGNLAPEGDRCEWIIELSLNTSDILPPEVSSTLGRTSYNRTNLHGGDCLKILFSYDRDEGVVRAGVRCEDITLSQEDLLDNLFPGDDGSLSPNIPLSLLNKSSYNDEVEDLVSTDEQNCIEEKPDDKRAGKPYHWCQVLGGLNFPPPSSRDIMGTAFEINTCTKAVIRQLLRRLRGRKTLSALLEYLGKRGQISHLVIHPAFKRDQSLNPQYVKAKLFSWVEEKEACKHVSYSVSTKRYIATIKRKAVSLKATVVVDIQSYPAEPPVWSLQYDDGSTATAGRGEQDGNSLNDSNINNANDPPLFDAGLHRIENRVNTELDQFINHEVEATYDWILIHQLSDIVSCWDELMAAGEGCGNTNGSDVQRRLRKGKDRRLVGFGENSPFFYYRCGMH